MEEQHNKTPYNEELQYILDVDKAGNEQQNAKHESIEIKNTSSSKEEQKDIYVKNMHKYLQKNHTTEEILILLEQFMGAFKEIRASAVPFLVELGDAWEKFDKDSGECVTQEEKSAFFYNVVQKFLNESTLGMHVLIKQMDTFFADATQNIVEECMQNRDTIQRIYTFIEKHTKKNLTFSPEENTVEAQLAQLEENIQKLEHCVTELTIDNQRLTSEKSALEADLKRTQEHFQNIKADIYKFHTAAKDDWLASGYQSFIENLLQTAFK